ncbi:MAG: hypothetical protein GC200_03960 [Tepidisphaera sp.]|nr:hypothetical protein [Tepidisphaera sp.]
MSYIDRTAEKIQLRDWSKIRQEWKSYVPNHKSPIPLPEDEIYELTSMASELKRMSGVDCRDDLIEYEIEGLRTAVFQEGIGLLHKACNVLRAGADAGTAGYRTWSRSNAYHAAFFGMRSVLALLGVIVSRSKDRGADYQTDIWHERRTKRPPSLTGCPFAIRVIQRDRVEHKELWGVFSRVLRVTKIDDSVWPKSKQNPLRTMAPGDFGKFRHKVHYRSVGWCFLDVDDVSERDDLSALAKDAVEFRGLGNADDPDFPFALGVHVTSLAAALVFDLGKDIPLLAQEAARNQSWMQHTPWGVANAFA